MEVRGGYLPGGFGFMAVTAAMDDVVFPHPWMPGDRANMFTLVTSVGPTLMKVETISDGEIIQQKIFLLRAPGRKLLWPESSPHGRLRSPGW